MDPELHQRGEPLFVCMAEASLASYFCSKFRWAVVQIEQQQLRALSGGDIMVCFMRSVANLTSLLRSLRPATHHEGSTGSVTVNECSFE